MKKLFILTMILSLSGCLAFAKNYESQKYYKMTERNSKGQKVGTTRVYYRGDKDNVTKVEKYNTKGKRTKQYK